MRVAFYGRLSDDRGGESTGIDRQRFEATALCTAKGWMIVAEYADSDLSAFRQNVRRPQFEKMLADAQEGQFDLILTWKLDRLVRRISEFGRVWSLLDRAGVGLASVKDSFDTSSTVGLIIVNVLIGVAQMESENISLRQRAKHAELIRQGRPSGGGRRGFGHTPDRLSVVPEEVLLIQDAAQRLVAGETLYGIERDWAASGVVTPAGTKWSRSHLRRMFLSPRLVGRRTADGKQGDTAPILDDDTWQAVVGILTRPGRFVNGYSGRKWLLGGIVSCGKCGASLRTKYRGGPKAAEKQVRRYACDGCYGVMISAEPLEKMLVEGVLDLLDNTDITDEKAPDQSVLLAQLRADEDALVQLTRSRYVDRLLTDAEFLPARAELTTRIEGARQQLSRSPIGVLQATKGKARQVWDSADLQKRRAILGAVIAKVVVLPATRHGPGFDPRRVAVTWHS